MDLVKVCSSRKYGAIRNGKSYLVEIIEVRIIIFIFSVLLNPWEKVCQNDNLFVQLEQAIGVFLKEVRCFITSLRYTHI